jgi:hypothetical protein
VVAIPTSALWECAVACPRFLSIIPGDTLARYSEDSVGLAYSLNRQLALRLVRSLGGVSLIERTYLNRRFPRFLHVIHEYFAQVLGV